MKEQLGEGVREAGAGGGVKEAEKARLIERYWSEETDEEE